MRICSVITREKKDHKIEKLGVFEILVAEPLEAMRSP
jgi:hypothetical protein